MPDWWSDERSPGGPRSDTVVLADANVLYSRVLRDYLLYAADEGAIAVRWSRVILGEVVEHLQANNSTIAALRRAGATQTADMMHTLLKES